MPSRKSMDSQPAKLLLWSPKKLIKLSRCFTVPHARLGWFLLMIGAISWQIFGRHADWSSMLFLQQELTQVNGIVLEVTPTEFIFGDGTNGASSYAIHFEFADSVGMHWEGRSWTEGLALRRGEQVPVEFVSSKPRLNRIVNFRSGPLPLWAGAVLLFPILGVICLLKVLLSNGDRMLNGRTGAQNGSEPLDALESPHRAS